jgi:alpha-maltose-1-phosphate synthase
VHTQQTVRTVEALSKWNPDTTLIVPGSAGETPADAEAAAERIARYYGLARRIRAVHVPGTGARIGALRLVKLTHAREAGRLLDTTSEPPDILYSRNLPTVISALRRGIPTVFETYRTMSGAYRFVAPVIRRAARSPHLRAIVTHSELSLESLAAAGVPREKLITVHNGYDTRELAGMTDRRAARSTLGLPLRAPIAVYTGHMGNRKGTPQLLDLAGQLPEMHFALVGCLDTRQLEECRIDSRRRGLSNVSWHPWTTTAGLVPWLSAADFLIIPPTTAPLEKGGTVLPIKVFTYLGAGRVVIGPALPDVEGVLENGYNAGFLTPDDPVAEAAELRRIWADRGLMAKLAEGAKKSAERFSWESRGERLLRVFENALAGRPLDGASPLPKK